MHNLGLRLTIAELNAKLKPDLTVLDAIRILVRNGPTGGSLSDVKREDIVIASKDWVAVDAYATRLFGKKPGFVPVHRRGRQDGARQVRSLGPRHRQVRGLTKL